MLFFLSSALQFFHHYVRKTHPRHVCMKNRDAQIMHLHHCISHYKIIRDVCPSTSLIRIHLRHVLVTACLQIEINPRRVIRACVADLIGSWCHCNTNRKHTLLDAHLLFDAPPNGHPGSQLHPEASQDLVAALYLYKQHTTYRNIWPNVANGDHTFNYIYQSYIIQSVHCLDHKA
jgi:hypothetical protein